MVLFSTRPKKNQPYFGYINPLSTPFSISTSILSSWCCQKIEIIPMHVKRVRLTKGLFLCTLAYQNSLEILPKPEKSSFQRYSADPI